MNSIFSDIYIFGELLFDCFDDETPTMGGAPFNVARHLKGFGLEPKLITAVGDDALGKQALDVLSAEAMDTSFVNVLEGRSTGTAKVSLSQGDAKYIIDEGVAFDYIGVDAKERLYHTGSKSALLYHGSLALRSSQNSLALNELSQLPFVSKFIDVNLRPPWWDEHSLLPRLNCAEAVKLNEEELSVLAERSDISGLSFHDTMFSFKHSHNIVNLIVTRGDKGAYFIDEADEFSECTEIPTHEVIDTVGAGDAFASICMVGMASDWDWSVTLLRAQEFAALMVGQRGAIPQDGSIYEDFRRLWCV